MVDLLGEATVVELPPVEHHLATVRSSVRNERPVWSPDGTRLAFTSDRAKITSGRCMEVFEVDLDGSGLRKLTPEESCPSFGYGAVQFRALGWYAS